jgi:hypothetical protein
MTTHINRRAIIGGIGASILLPTPAILRAQSAALRSSAFRSLTDALSAWQRLGGTLIIDRDHVETRPLTVICERGLTYRLLTEGQRRISYAGPHTHWLFCMLGRGANPVEISGDLSFDGRNRCSMPLFLRFELVGGVDRRNMTLVGIRAMNARMRAGRSQIDGAPTNAYGATALLVSGGIDRLHIHDVSVSTVGRDAGAGLPGSKGCIGIGVTGNLSGTQSPRHILIEDFSVSDINSDDRPSSPARSDMDGVLVFQTAEVAGTRPIVRRGVIREAAGRGVKIFAPGGGGVTRDLNIYRSVVGKQDGAIDIAHQHGDGVIENIRIHYSGNAHATPTIPIGISSGYVRGRGFAFGDTVVRNIVIDDTTGQTKRAIFGLQYNERDATARHYRLSDITDNGSADYLLLPGALGTYGDADITLDRISVNLSRGLLATEDANVRLRINANTLTNRNPRSVPVRTYYDGSTAAAGHRIRLTRGAGVRGLLPQAGD